MSSTKASNAVVAIVDFYATELAETLVRVEQLEGVVGKLGDQLRRAAQRAQLEAVVLAKARALLDDWDHGGPEGDFAELRNAVAALDAAPLDAK